MSEEKQPLRMTIGELRALVAEVWGTFPGRVTITVTPSEITVSTAPDRAGEARILISQRVGVDEDTDSAHVIVASAAKKIAEDIEIRRGVVADAHLALDTARKRLAQTETLRAKVDGILGRATASEDTGAERGYCRDRFCALCRGLPPPAGALGVAG